MPKATLHVGDAKETLERLPPESVQTCVTSPPYWGLRSYLDADDPKKENELGAEETPEEYVRNLVEVFRGVRRVLHPSGCAWLNLGDTYARPGSKGDNSGYGKHAEYVGDGLDLTTRTVPADLKEKDLCMIPSRVVLALQDDGWYVRSRICWAKGNPLPESVKDRPTSSHEYIFLLSKQKRYFYDADAIREPYQTDKSENYPGRVEVTGRGQQSYNNQYDGNGQQDRSGGFPSAGGRNKRDVWEVNTKPFPDAHFATFPPGLIVPPILAGTSKKGQCPNCGSPYERVVTREDGEPESYKSSRFDTGKTDGHQKGRAQEGERTTRVPTDDWEPTCECNAGDPEPQTVLDPFSGAGTTGLVALAKGRDFIGIDLSREYCEMAADRIRQDAPLMNDVEIVD